ncbi:hypothetical protein GJ631_09510 [Natronomonas sp. CBA1123]|jgi:hypothetical protein|uniref:hypothetical protein n=1 Tax=Natronomonas sp. CBA1123 TaxID=2668070 RepID=UPI0012EA6240|nr:hypothetical protein [Natronomonas sp. CBA1123]MUV86793.1 hypothetical protein [Natronomonas sp. CBA1123]
MATSDSSLPLFDHTHDTATTALAVAAAAVTAFYAAWLTADLLPRTVVFGVVALTVGFLLYRRPDRRAVAASGLYAVAILLAATPIALNATVLATADMTGITDPWARILTVTDLKILLGFLVVAAVPAAIGYYLNNAASVRRRLSALRER